MKPSDGRAAEACLFILFLMAPFEPRFTVSLGFMGVSLVEAIAIPSFLVAAIARLRFRDIWTPHPAIRALILFSLVALISAALAAESPMRAFKFALRLGAMTALAVLAARLGEREVRFAFSGLALSGVVAAGLAIAEGLGARRLDFFLGAFREMPFNVAGVRRATGGSEYPNLGAAMLVYALLSGASLLKKRQGLRAAFVVLLAGGLAFTYSRGAWLAGLAGLMALAVTESGLRRFVPSAVYVLLLGAFVAREEITQLRLGSENANDFYSAVYVVPPEYTFSPGERTLVPVTLTNTGQKPWRVDEQFHLSYHLFETAAKPLIDGPRSDLPRDVRPGESVTIQAEVRIPAKAGRYLLLWDLVHEDTTWFSGQGVRPGAVRLRSGNPASATDAIREDDAVRAIPDALGWRPSRLKLWRIAARMWAANPFFGVGPDNFRWTYGTAAGKAAFDTRVFANNLFFELAATVGTLGLASFLAALVFAVSSAYAGASLSPSACAAFAVLVAMTVHGLTDYLFAFTGHYLVLGLAMGTAARFPRTVPGK